MQSCCSRWEHTSFEVVDMWEKILFLKHSRSRAKCLILQHLYSFRGIVFPKFDQIINRTRCRQPNIIGTLFICVYTWAHSYEIKNNEYDGTVCPHLWVSATSIEELPALVQASRKHLLGMNSPPGSFLLRSEPEGPPLWSQWAAPSSYSVGAIFALF